MVTYSDRLNLVLPALTDPANVQTIITNWKRLDNTAGLVLCTESTKPGTDLFDGFYIKCTDSGKHYLWNGSNWEEDVYVTYIGLTLTGSGLVFYGAHMAKPYIFGATAGQSAPGIDFPAETHINLGSTYGPGVDGRGLNALFALSGTKTVHVELHANLGSVNSPVAPLPPVPRPNFAYELSSNSRIRFDLWDNNAFKATIGWADPEIYFASTSVGTGFQFDGAVTTQLAGGAHTLEVYATNEQEVDGSASHYTAIWNADLKVEVSAA